MTGHQEHAWWDRVPKTGTNGNRNPLPSPDEVMALSAATGGDDVHSHFFTLQGSPWTTRSMGRSEVKGRHK